jgi:N-methylhydantoinase B
VVRDTDVARQLAAGIIPGSLDELGGHRELVQNRTETLVGLADAIFMHPSGGGGYGDPLLRDPGRVAVDVQAGKVSAAVASDVYGVVLDPQLAADHAATEKSRDEIRRSRAGSEVTPITPQPASAETGIPIDANLAILRDADEQATAICRHCQRRIGSWGSDLAGGTVVRDSPVPGSVPGMPADTGGYVEADLVFRTFCCPGCGTQLRTEIVPSDVPAAMR